MKKTTKIIAIAFLMIAISPSAIFAQTPKKVSVKKINTTKVQVAASEDKTEIPVKQDVKKLLLNEWEFHQITMRTRKDGFLISVTKKTTGMLSLLIANYTFNSDGTITLDPKYMEKQGIKEAKWLLNDSGELEITYYWTVEKHKETGYTNNYEKLEYKIDAISEKELIISFSDMVFVTLTK